MEVLASCFIVEFRRQRACIATELFLVFMQYAHIWQCADLSTHLDVVFALECYILDSSSPVFGSDLQV